MELHDFCVFIKYIEMMELVVVIVSTYMNIKIIAVHRSNVINLFTTYTSERAD